MSKLFGRNYRLTIRRGEDELVYRPPMQIRFTVDIKQGSAGSTAEITLYGAARATRRAIYNQFDEISLEAGYGDDIGMIFSGDIINHETGREGVDSYIKFYCRTAGKAQAEGYISKPWGENTPQIDIIREVAETLLLPVEFVGDFSDLPRAIKGATICKPSVTCLNELSKNHGFEWILSPGRLMIVRKGSGDGQASRDTPPHLVSAGTGMIGSPQILIQQVEVKKKLDPAIIPGERIEIQAETRNFASSNVYTADRMEIDPTGGNGVYSVMTTRHTGDFSGDAWETAIGGVRDRS